MNAQANGDSRSLICASSLLAACTVGQGKSRHHRIQSKAGTLSAACRAARLTCTDENPRPRASAFRFREAPSPLFGIGIMLIGLFGLYTIYCDWRLRRPARRLPKKMTENYGTRTGAAIPSMEWTRRRFRLDPPSSRCLSSSDLSMLRPLGSMILRTSTDWLISSRAA